MSNPGSTTPTRAPEGGKTPAAGAQGGSPVAQQDSAKRYKATLNLPQTSFPMKASLVQNEPASQKRWTKMGIYRKLRERANSGRYVFHDGPPYANGAIHLGHLMNKTLKDFVVRSKGMAGLDCPFVPGWDCHGLPIEHKVQTELVEAGKYEKIKGLDEWTRRAAVRRECHKHAEKYVKLQSGQMQRLLTLADYDHPYLTMAPEYEAAVLDVLATLMERGLVYRALKPVHWSVANETALAEAELEYYDREDISVYVDFEAVEPGAVYDAFGLPENAEESEEEATDETDSTAGERSAGPPRGRPGQRPTFMIWTTTPWTLPANLAIAVNPKFEYALAWVDGNVCVLAAEAVERVTKAAGAESVEILARCRGEKLVGLRYRHPFVDLGRGESVTSEAFGGRGKEPPRSGWPPKSVLSVVAAEYVTLEDGTGLVHTAPGHGEEDYLTGKREGLPVYCPVRGDGTYDQTVPEWLRGVDVWKANELVVKNLRDSGHLFYDHKFTHSYPHDWRSKTPTIFRCTEQWFVSVEQPFAVGPEAPCSLRGRGLSAVEPGSNAVAFVPEWGRNRMRGMLESRPDWCISRQRAWGLPIPAFVLADGTVFMTAASVRAVMSLVRAKGSDAWFQMQPAELLAGYSASEDPAASAAVREAAARGWEAVKKGGDIIDVWFESGSSWNAVMRQRNLGYPTDLYLEGSDQHRGWFQASLLPALGVTGQPPYKTLLTHGFMVDKDGRKLSKSRPDAARYEVDSLTTEFGVDVMRWWVASLPYENDVKVDVEFFAVAGESYRKVRNTLRFMLSNLYDFAGASLEQAGWTRPSRVPPSTFSKTSLDMWVLDELNKVCTAVWASYENFDYKTAQQKLYDFCNDTLSAVYLAAVKDRLYCDKSDSARRRQTQNALLEITDGLCKFLAPIMPHTADEAYRALWKAGPESDLCVHLTTFPPDAPAGADPAWGRMMEVREEALVAMERFRQDLKAREGAGNPNAKAVEPMDLGVVLPDPEGVLAKLDPVDLADLLGVSLVRLDGAAKEVKIEDRRGEPQCERSWKRDGTVKKRSDGGMLSDRDAAAVGVA
jgi:isoleucyl-tRNA synthetase